MYCKTAKTYIKKLVRTRKQIIKNGLGYKNAARMVEIIKELSLYLDAYDYTNHQMAGFWIKHRDEIADLLPGAKAKNHNSLISEFEQLDNKAKELKNLVTV